MATRERQKQLLTVGVLVLSAALVLASKNGWRFPYLWSTTADTGPTLAAGPQDAIYGMLDAARRGDVKAYLLCYTGPMQTALEGSVKESTPDRFAKYLRDSGAAIKGVAAFEPEPAGDREVKVRVEYIYQDRDETQTVYLEKVLGAWKITRVDSAESVKTLVPYGTPVK